VPWQAEGPAGRQPSGQRRPQAASAQEGIPELELGRSSIARTSDPMLDRGPAEALPTFTPGMGALRALSRGAMIEEIGRTRDSLAIHGSPVHILAVFKGVLPGEAALSGVSSLSETLAAFFVGTASDNTIPISADTGMAATSIPGALVPDGTAAGFATETEAVRVAILCAHGRIAWSNRVGRAARRGQHKKAGKTSRKTPSGP